MRWHAAGPARSSGELKRADLCVKDDGHHPGVAGLVAWRRDRRGAHRADIGAAFDHVMRLIPATAGRWWPWMSA